MTDTNYTPVDEGFDLGLEEVPDAAADTESTDPFDAMIAAAERGVDRLSAKNMQPGDYVAGFLAADGAETTSKIGTSVELRITVARSNIADIIGGEVRFPLYG